MSRHTAYRFNLTRKAILVTVLGFGTINAQAINLGQPTIQSEQNEPLSATIDVSNIDANQFEASIASSSIYAQMGLTQLPDIKATFVRTSDTSGKIVLTSTTPIATPFADIVLDLSNNGEQILEPQTLLMPLSPTSMTSALIAQEPQNLPVIEPLAQNQDEPFVAPQMSAIQLPVQTDESLPSRYAPMFAQPSKEVLSNEVLASLKPKGTNKEFNILTEQITRTIYPRGEAPINGLSVNENDQNPYQDAYQSTQDNYDQPTDQSDIYQETLVNETPKSSDLRYVVQSGDTLWSIANQIAKANNISIDEVMTALHKQNPDAFNNGKMSQLKTNATLQIPAYDVVPSQKAIEEAIASRRATPSKMRPVIAKTQSRPTRPTRPKTVVKPLPRPQVTLVTPTQNTQLSTNETGVSTQAGNGQLVNALKNTRNQAVQSAKRVNGLNEELSSAAQKLELQNQKLADLEARLRALKDKQ